MAASIEVPDAPPDCAIAARENPISVVATAALAMKAPMAPRRVSAIWSMSLLHEWLVKQLPHVLAREVPVETVLEAEVLAGVAVVVGAPSPQQLTARENAARRVPQQVCRRVLTFVKGRCRLETGIVD